MRSTRLLKAYAQLGKKSSSLHIAQARGRNKIKESKKLVKLKVAVEDLRNEITELTTSVDEEQTIVCAFVTFDKCACGQVVCILRYLRAVLLVGTLWQIRGLPESAEPVLGIFHGLPLSGPPLPMERHR